MAATVPSPGGLIDPWLSLNPFAPDVGRAIAPARRVRIATRGMCCVSPFVGMHRVVERWAAR